jgi:tripartite-type tricarboxylate transporter receptor subunit TctC
LAIGLLLGGPISSAGADDVSAFYAGRQITFVAPTSVGGGFDLYSRLFAETVRKFIPGQPSIVVQNMPGAGGLRAAGYIFNVAPKDGSVIGMPLANIPLSEVIEPGAAKYQSAKFSWIGTITPETDVLGVWRDAGVSSLEDARQKEITIGATGKFGLLAMNVNLANALLGTRFKVVLGYPSGNEVNLAMENREVQGRTNQWTSWKSQRPDWVKDNRLSFLLQIGPRESELPDVPVFLDLVRSPRNQAMVRLLQSNQVVGRPAARSISSTAGCVRQDRARSGIPSAHECRRPLCPAIARRRAGAGNLPLDGACRGHGPRSRIGVKALAGRFHPRGTRTAKMGMEARSSTPQQLDDLDRSELAHWGDAVKASGYVPE